MNNVRIITGNIFTSSCKVLVNTVNCSGVMGAGLALECRLRYPAMFEQYVQQCERKLLDVGKLWLFHGKDRSILNFPTKKHWRLPSKATYLHQGLRKFMDTYQERGIESVAFPLLGAQHGGLDPEASLALMLGYLEQCTIPVEIYRYDPKATDDLYEHFKALLESLTDERIRTEARLRSNQIKALRLAMASTRVRQLNQLAAYDGIGEKTLEAAFALTRLRLEPAQQGLL